MQHPVKYPTLPVNLIGWIGTLIWSIGLTVCVCVWRGQGVVAVSAEWLRPRPICPPLPVHHTTPGTDPLLYPLLHLLPGLPRALPGALEGGGGGHIEAKKWSCRMSLSCSCPMSPLKFCQFKKCHMACHYIFRPC